MRMALNGLWLSAAIARMCLAALGAKLRRLKEQILEFDRTILAWHRSNEAAAGDNVRTIEHSKVA